MNETQIIYYSSEPKRTRRWHWWLGIAVLAVLAVVVGNFLVFNLLKATRPVYGGGRSSSYGNADRRTTTQVEMQDDPRGNLLFVIAWTSEHGGGTSSRSQQNLLTSIHGHPVHPSLHKPAVYVLQQDYSLQEVPLSEAERAALFGEMRRSGFHVSHSELWQQKVTPRLVKIEAPSE